MPDTPATAVSDSRSTTLGSAETMSRSSDRRSSVSLDGTSWHVASTPAIGIDAEFDALTRNNLARSYTRTRYTARGMGT
jgi:hypothetical protein